MNHTLSQHFRCVPLILKSFFVCPHPLLGDAYCFLDFCLFLSLVCMYNSYILKCISTTFACLLITMSIWRFAYSYSNLMRQFLMKLLHFFTNNNCWKVCACNSPYILNRNSSKLCMLGHYHMWIHISLQPCDQTISEGIIVPFHLEYFNKNFVLSPVDCFLN